MYTITRIRKKHGGIRLIYKPSPKLRRRIAYHMPELIQRMLDVCDYRICHGFMPGRSPVTNASYHIGYRFTVSFDLSCYFDTITAQHLRGIVDEDVLETCLLDGSPRQGLPSSPALANISGAALDADLAALGYRYTRYADDLTFSTDFEWEVNELLFKVPGIVESHGFRVNPSKTHVQGYRQGRRRITGVCVDENGVHESRRNRRKRRAARHQKHEGSANGLAAWYGSPRVFCPICLAKKPMKYRGGDAEWLNGHLRLLHQLRVPLDEINAMFSWRGSVLDMADAVEEIRERYVVGMLA